MAAFLSFVPNSQASQKTLLVFGDSLSAAYGLATEQGWVSLLHEKLQQTNPDWQVVNLSISGETTAGGLSRLPAALDKHQPELMLLQLGANDGLRGTSLKSMKSNLEQMIAEARSNNTQVMLFEMQIPPNYGPVYTKRFTQTFFDLGKTYGLPVVPFFLNGVAGIAELNQADGIHPVAKAQPALLDNVWIQLKPVLKPVPKP